ERLGGLLAHALQRDQVIGLRRAGAGASCSAAAVSLAALVLAGLALFVLAGLALLAAAAGGLGALERAVDQAEPLCRARRDLVAGRGVEKRRALVAGRHQLL